MKLAGILLLPILTFVTVSCQFERIFQKSGIVDADVGTGKILIQSELKIEVLELPEDCTRKSVIGDTLVFDYEAEIDGKIIEDSHNTGKEEDAKKQPLVVSPGKGTSIAGLENGVMGMCVGEKRKLVIPPHLAFGQKGIPGVVPENCEITFTLELLQIVPKSWGEYYVEFVWAACYLAFIGGIFVLIAQNAMERRKAMRRELKKMQYWSQ